jgi:hypothetical protein
MCWRFVLRWSSSCGLLSPLRQTRAHGSPEAPPTQNVGVGSRWWTRDPHTTIVEQRAKGTEGGKIPSLFGSSALFSPIPALGGGRSAIVRLVRRLPSLELEFELVTTRLAPHLARVQLTVSQRQSIPCDPNQGLTLFPRVVLLQNSVSLSALVLALLDLSLLFEPRPELFCHPRTSRSARLTFCLQGLTSSQTSSWRQMSPHSQLIGRRESL